MAFNVNNDIVKEEIQTIEDLQWTEDAMAASSTLQSASPQSIKDIRQSLPFGEVFIGTTVVEKVDFLITKLKDIDKSLNESTVKEEDAYKISKAIIWGLESNSSINKILSDFDAKTKMLSDLFFECEKFPDIRLAMNSLNVEQMNQFILISWKKNLDIYENLRIVRMSVITKMTRLNLVRLNLLDCRRIVIEKADSFPDFAPDLYIVDSGTSNIIWDICDSIEFLSTFNQTISKLLKLFRSVSDFWKNRILVRQVFAACDVIEKWNGWKYMESFSFLEMYVEKMEGVITDIKNFVHNIFAFLESVRKEGTFRLSFKEKQELYDNFLFLSHEIFFNIEYFKKDKVIAEEYHSHFCNVELPYPYNVRARELLNKLKLLISALELVIEQLEIAPSVMK